MVTEFLVAAERRAVSLLICFVDIGHFFRFSLRIPDAGIADLLDEFYSRIHSRVTASGGHVVKYMGDSALIVFPEDGVDEGVLALLGLRDEIDRWLAGMGVEASLTVKVHFGTVIAGPFGPEGARRFDVIGNNVNLAAVLQTRAMALSAQAFRRLSKETRRRFKKHTPPVIYIPLEEARPKSASVRGS